MLYGVSYGTAVAQTYAAAHPDHLSGLVLDGTIDLTLNGEEGSLAQEKAFDKVLVATLNSCNEDEACAADMGGDAVAVYDKLAKQISEKPIKYKFPLPSGENSRTHVYLQSMGIYNCISNVLSRWKNAVPARIGRRQSRRFYSDGAFGLPTTYPRP